MAAQVLITGATGHIGFAVLVGALQEGYSVRAALRVLSAKDKILNALSLRSGNLSKRLTFVEVPDILAEGAFTEAIVNIDYVIHVASPIPQNNIYATDLHGTFIVPAIRGTINILEAARSNPKVKRVVVTSSIAGNHDPRSPTAVASPHIRMPIPDYADAPSAYITGKHAALLATDVFMAEHEPHFDVINLMPAWTIGRKELATSSDEALSGSNDHAFALVLRGIQPYSLPGGTVHLEDVVVAHVKALKLQGKANRTFGLTRDFDPNAVFDILKKELPDAVEKGVFKQPKEHQPFHLLHWDASETEAAFGIVFKGVEEQVLPVAKQYLELRGAS